MITSRRFKEEALIIGNPMISKKDLIIKQMKQLRKKLNKKWNASVQTHAHDNFLPLYILGQIISYQLRYLI